MSPVSKREFIPLSAFLMLAGTALLSFVFVISVRCARAEASDVPACSPEGALSTILFAAGLLGASIILFLRSGPSPSLPRFFALGAGSMVAWAAIAEIGIRMKSATF